MTSSQQSLFDSLEVDLKPSNARLVTFPESVEKALYPGAHIATGESGLGKIYHHGIVLDNTENMKILHFWGYNQATAKIQTATLAAFLAGSPELIGTVSRPLYLISYSDDNDEKREETLKRARGLLKDAAKVSYNLVYANCECVAIYCRTGKWVSEQVVKCVNKLIENILQKVKQTSTGTLLGSVGFSS